MDKKSAQSRAQKIGFLHHIRLVPFFGSVLGGILLAHVFFNMPLAARWLLFALEAIPAGQWRLAAQLGMPAATRWRWIEWPAVRTQLLPLASLIFLLCFSSFTTVMALGVMCIISKLYGLDSIFTFAFPLMMGMISGVYTSLCVSTSAWVLWSERKPKTKA